MNRQPSLYFFSILFTLFLSTPHLYGQVATASLDPTYYNTMPAATSWRYGSTVGIRYKQGIGYGETDTIRDSALTDTNSNAIASFQMSTASLEIGYKSFQEVIDADADASTDTTIKGSKTNLNLAVRGLGFASLGVKYHTYTENVESTTSSVTASSEAKTTGFGGGVSFRFIQILYLAGGVERVSSTSPDTVDNSWLETSLGLALLTGKPGATQFRLEYNYIGSPEKIESASDSLSQSEHKETTEYTGHAELLWRDFLFSFKGYTKTQKATSSSGDDQITTTNTYGFAWKAQEGFTIGSYYSQSKLETSPTTLYRDNQVAISVGYSWF